MSANDALQASAIADDRVSIDVRIPEQTASAILRIAKAAGVDPDVVIRVVLARDIDIDKAQTDAYAEGRKDQREEDAADAMRYRWLKARALWRPNGANCVTWDVDMPEPDIRAGVLTESSVGDELDAAIDAAIGAMR